MTPKAPSDLEKAFARIKKLEAEAKLADEAHEKHFINHTEVCEERDQYKTTMEALALYFQPDIRRGPAHEDWLDTAELYLATNPTTERADSIRWLVGVARPSAKVNEELWKQAITKCTCVGTVGVCDESGMARCNESLREMNRLMDEAEKAEKGKANAV